MRRKVGVRKRHAVREGNVLVGSETNAAAGQRPVAVRGGGHWRRLVVAVRGGGRWCHFVVGIRSCSFVYVPRCSLPSLALRLALGEVEGASRRTSLAARRWWWRVSWVGVSSRRLWWSWVVFVGAGRRLRVAVCFASLFSCCWALVVIRWLVVVVLGRLASCERVGLVYRYMGPTWWRSGCGLSLGDVSRLWAEPLAWWWLVEEEGRHVTRM